MKTRVYERKKRGANSKPKSKPAPAPVLTITPPKAPTEEREKEAEKPTRNAVQKKMPAARLIETKKDEVEAKWIKNKKSSTTTTDHSLFRKMGKNQEASWQALARESANIVDVENAEDYQLQEEESSEESNKILTREERKAADLLRIRFFSRVDVINYNTDTPPGEQKIEQAVGEPAPLITGSKGPVKRLSKSNI